MTSGDRSDFGLDVLNRSGESIEVALAKQLIAWVHIHPLMRGSRRAWGGPHAISKVRMVIVIDNLLLGVVARSTYGCFSATGQCNAAVHLGVGRGASVGVDQSTPDFIGARGLSRSFAPWLGRQPTQSARRN